MQYCRFLLDNQIHYGVVQNRAGGPHSEFRIEDLAPAPEEDLAFRLTHGRATATNLGFEPLPLASAQLLPAVAPSKIVCVGRNYRDHVKETGQRTSHRAPDLPQAAVVSARPRRHRPHARRFRPRRLRG